MKSAKNKRFAQGWKNQKISVKIMEKALCRLSYIAENDIIEHRNVAKERLSELHGETDNYTY